MQIYKKYFKFQGVDVWIFLGEVLSFFSFILFLRSNILLINRSTLTQLKKKSFFYNPSIQCDLQYFFIKNCLKLY
jgi:hypothetical protein